ncbi:hypothetical protein HYZ80_00080 [Candidatus Parcubacteria bacterium]|nr:hypothetical protein [Candidatus Parcubacteria bacterium]
MPKAKLPFKEFTLDPELAYIIGLLVTDGNLSKYGRHITMRSSDKDLLETFGSCLNLKSKIARSHNDGYAKRPSYRIQFSNVQLYNWLVTIGVTPAKTHSIGAIRIPKELFRDFLRGHLDGDGSIFFYRDTYNVYKGKRYINTRIYTKFISASEKHIKWLHEMMGKHAPAHGALIGKKPVGGRCGMWEIKIAKYESLKLLRWLYYKKGLPALARKRKIAEYLLSHVRNNKLIRI